MYSTAHSQSVCHTVINANTCMQQHYAAANNEGAMEQIARLETCLQAREEELEKEKRERFVLEEEN